MGIEVSPDTSIRNNDRWPSWYCKNKRPRRVCFADALGLQLTFVKFVSESIDTPPRLKSSIIQELHSTSEEESAPLKLSPKFQQPIAEFSSFLARVKNGVSLESVAVTNCGVCGVIKVKNIHFEKRVFLRYTTDSWRTYADHPCQFDADNNQRASVYDSFSFQLPLDNSVTSLEFCVGFSHPDGLLWDNNHGQNYKF